MNQKGIDNCYDSIEELNKSIIDLLKILKGIQPITTKFSRSKKNLEKSLSNFSRKLVAIQEVIKESEDKLLEFKE